MTRAVVVGSGPNGLAAALTLARAGVEVQVLEARSRPGGGTRSTELTLPGLVHDECSAFHPLAVDTAFSRSARLDQHGLSWCWPQVQYSHPLEDGTGSAAFRSLPETANRLGTDADQWSRVFGPIVSRFDGISADFLRPLAGVPQHPLAMIGFGLRAAPPASLLARCWSTPEARSLFAGVAAHAMRPLSSPLSSAIGVALAAAAHTFGWPVAAGGSASITDAMLSALRSEGGTVTTDVSVRSLADVGPADIVMLDVAPRAAALIAGDRVSARIRRALLRYRHGPGSFKVDFAVEGGVPWTHLDSRSAGTVHLGGTLEQVAFAEREVSLGRMPDNPFVLVGQQFVADPTRGQDGVVPLYAYAHVPAGYDGDATDVIESTIERYAPGFRDRVLARHSTSTLDLASENANYVGGDVVTGANTARQLLMRPRPALDPYRLGAGIYLCSAATPPGAGAHGMCGYNAASSALRRLR